MAFSELNCVAHGHYLPELGDVLTSFLLIH
jgi:hypothetical protein